MNRPTGVTVLAVLAFIGGGLTILTGLLFMLGSAFLAQRIASLPQFVAALAGVGGVILLGFGVLDLVVGFGLLALANWARILTMIGAALGLAGAAMRLLGSMAFLRIALVSRHLVMGALYAFVLWYLSQPHVKRAFGAAAPAAPKIS